MSFFLVWWSQSGGWSISVRSDSIISWGKGRMLPACNLTTRGLEFLLCIFFLLCRIRTNSFWISSNTQLVCLPFLVLWSGTVQASENWNYFHSSNASLNVVVLPHASPSHISSHTSLSLSQLNSQLLSHPSSLKSCSFLLLINILEVSNFYFEILWSDNVNIFYRLR